MLALSPGIPTRNWWWTAHPAAH
ncbi:trp operon leader peptide [Streptomyces sp. NPDC002306]